MIEHGGSYRNGNYQNQQNQRRSAFGVNRIILVGSIIYGPEDKHNGQVVQLGISTGNTSSTKAPNGMPEDYRETYDIIVYGNTAKYLISNNPPKGTWLYVEGRIRKRKWYDRDGKARYSYDIVAQRVIILNKMVHAWEKQANIQQSNNISRNPNFNNIPSPQYEPELGTPLNDPPGIDSADPFAESNSDYLGDDHPFDGSDDGFSPI